jgi:O-antigen/teichoic acid export membrane protein
MSSSVSNKSIAKNTLLMYIRMLFMMVISLYTSRIILHELGIEDFGIYNITNGIIISFSFLSTALISASQRYLAFSLGKEDFEDFKKYFSSSFMLYAVLGLLICVVILPIGIWLLESKLTIPIGKHNQAIILFYTVIVTFFLSFLRIPFYSAVIAKERFSFYAYLGIVEAILKLIIVYCLVLSPSTKLVLYGFLQLLVALFIDIIFAIYTFASVKINLVKVREKRYYRDLLTFSGWSLFEALASIGKTEFVNFILNIFYGVFVNAAYGIAKQVFSAINAFTSNFQTAYRPQLTKCYAANNIDYLHELIINTSKFSTVIFSIVAIPICLNIDYLLDLWLTDVPKYSSYFAVFFIMSSALETISGPFWITAHAVGKIKWFQIITGIVRLLSIPLVFLYVKFDYPVKYVFVMLVLSDFVVCIYRIIYLYNTINFPFKTYIKEVFLKLTFVFLLAIYIPVVVTSNLTDGFAKLLLSSFCSIAIISLATYFYLLTKKERDKLLYIVVNIFNKVKH